MDAAQAKNLPSTTWQYMSTSGIKMPELYGLMHKTSEAGMPKAAVNLAEMVQRQLGRPTL